MGRALSWLWDHGQVSLPSRPLPSTEHDLFFSVLGCQGLPPPCGSPYEPGRCDSETSRLHRSSHHGTWQERSQGKELLHPTVQWLWPSIHLFVHSVFKLLSVLCHLLVGVRV